jgi:hypothetical protein
VPRVAAAAKSIPMEKPAAVLLFAQFSILRSRAILVLASGYLFTMLDLWLMVVMCLYAIEMPINYCPRSQTAVVWDDNERRCYGFSGKPQGTDWDTASRIRRSGSPRG